MQQIHFSLVLTFTSYINNLQKSQIKWETTDLLISTSWIFVFIVNVPIADRKIGLATYTVAVATASKFFHYLNPHELQPTLN